MKENEKQNIWLDNYIIRNYHTGISGKATLQNIVNILIEASSDHTRFLNISVHDLMKENKTWMLSRLHVKINDFPQWHDDVKIETWPSGAKKLFSCRDYLISNKNNSPLILGTSGWLVVDLTKRRPARLPDAIKILQENALPPIIKDDFKPIQIKENFKYKKEFTVRVSDIDINRHVTAVSYIDWILNSLPMDFHVQNKLTDFEINFKAEALYPDKITAFTKLEKDGNTVTAYHKLVNNKDELIHVTAKSVWKRED